MKTVVVMPAYEAGETLEATLRKLPRIYDEVILCDDGSTDRTREMSERLGITTLRHARNRGYGANQKTLYREALMRNPEVIVMVHPDNQYDTSPLPQMAAMIREGKADMVIGSRMLHATQNRMPFWKYAGNRLLTSIQNAVFKTALSEFHSGLRAYRASIIREMPFERFADGFVFDSEVIAWFLANGYVVGETPADCFYRSDSSSVGFGTSVRYGMGTLRTLARFIRGDYRARKNFSSKS